MAVQKSHTTRSRRGMRRAHDGLSASCLSKDPVTGESHRRHHISPEGYYKGRQVVAMKDDALDDEE